MAFQLEAILMSFHEVLFPETISYGSSGGPRFKTSIFEADSGHEQRNIDWQDVKAEFDVAHAIKSVEQMEELTAFFMARRGRAYGFRFKDWADYRLRQQVIGVGDDVQTVFQIYKSYRSYSSDSGSDTTYIRNLRKIAWGSVAGVTADATVLTSPTDYVVDYDTGILTLTDPLPDGEELKIGSAEFHVPVRFDTDHLDVTHEFWNTTSWPNIPLVEVPDWEEVMS